MKKVEDLGEGDLVRVRKFYNRNSMLVRLTHASEPGSTGYVWLYGRRVKQYRDGTVLPIGKSRSAYLVHRDEIVAVNGQEVTP